MRSTPFLCRNGTTTSFGLVCKSLVNLCLHGGFKRGISFGACCNIYQFHLKQGRIMDDWKPTMIWNEAAQVAIESAHLCSTCCIVPETAAVISLTERHVKMATLPTISHRLTSIDSFVKHKGKDQCLVCAIFHSLQGMNNPIVSRFTSSNTHLVPAKLVG